MICDRFTPLDLVSRNTRSKIRRGLKKCSVIKVDKDQILENGFDGFKKATGNKPAPGNAGSAFNEIETTAFF